jgi:glycosyltransferase involved in cell wall biosynthesis
MAAKVVYSFEAQKKLRELLENFPADVAHLHCIYHHLSPAILPVLKKAGVPVVMTAHDLKIACPAYKMLNASGICERCNGGSVLNVIKHRCVRGSLATSTVVAAESAVHRFLNTYQTHVDRVVVPSRFFMKKFIEWGWPEDKFVYIPNYVNTSRFKPAFDGGDYFLYFGRLAPEKGVSTLMTALQSALEADVEFLGYRSGEALSSLVGGAKAVVLPSEWYENAPMSVLESFALGKPVIGADIGGIPEMVEEGVSGWCFESGNVEALAKLLSRVQAMSAGEIAACGRAARALVEQRFNRAAYTSSMLETYATLGIPASAPAAAAR